MLLQKKLSLLGGVNSFRMLLSLAFFNILCMLIKIALY